jgi:uncharacterized protein YkwD
MQSDFLPSDFKCMILKNMKLRLIIILIILAGFACSRDEVVPTPNLNSVMLEEVNKLRRSGCQCGTQFMPPVHELTWNDTLAIAAERHARDMYDHNYLEHISPSGSSPIQRAMEAGYSGNYVGENIARGYFTLKQVMDAWKNSESHCMTMMDTLYYEMGAAQASDYWDQEFGRP